jgi:molybdopterin/thiamine biosynthesis adenylyltransferase
MTLPTPSVLSQVCFPVLRLAGFYYPTQLRHVERALEVRVSHMRVKRKALRKIVKYFTANKGVESLAVGIGFKRPDPKRPGWYWVTLEGAIIPRDDEYLTRTSAFIHMDPNFLRRVNRLLEEVNARSGKHYVVVLIDHRQPIDVLSGEDFKSAVRFASYYPCALFGSFNKFHRFFRVTPHGEELVSWDIEGDETYSRQVLAVGDDVQRTVASTRVLIVGAGGVGSKLFFDLVLMSYGVVDIVDPDEVEVSNLSRLMLSESSVGKSKVHELLMTASKLKSNTLMNGYAAKVQQLDARLFANYDYVICATDNPNSRLWVNEQCVKLRIPCIQVGSNLRGMKALSCRTTVAGWNPCYECWFYQYDRTEDLKRDHFTKEQRLTLKARGYGLPRPSPAIVTVNTLAAGLAEEALFRLVTNQPLVAQLYLDLESLTLKSTSSQKRNPNCVICSQIPDYDLTFLESSVKEA